MGGDVSGGIANDPVDRMDAGPVGGSRGGGGAGKYYRYVGNGEAAEVAKTGAIPNTRISGDSKRIF